MAVGIFSSMFNFTRVYRKVFIKPPKASNPIVDVRVTIREACVDAQQGGPLFQSLYFKDFS